MRMPDRVGERLLHDAVRGEVDACRKVGRDAVDRQLDAQPGVASMGDERIQITQRRLRGELGRGVAQHADQPAHLAERLATDPLDGQQCLAFLGPAPAVSMRRTPDA